MKSIWDRLTLRHRVEQLESELAKYKRLEKAIEEFYGILGDHQKAFEEIRHTLAEFARGLNVLGEVVNGVNANCEQITPHIGQLQLNQSRFIASFQQLVEVLIEADVIHRLPIEIDRVH